MPNYAAINFYSFLQTLCLQMPKLYNLIFFCITTHYNPTIMSFEYGDFYPKIFLFLDTPGIEKQQQHHDIM